MSSLTVPSIVTIPPAPPTASPVCQLLAWDSRFFGLRVARLCGHRLTIPRAEEASRWCRAHQVDCLYFRADADDAATVEAAEWAGFRFVDVRSTFLCQLASRRPVLSSPAIRQVDPADIPELERIASANHILSRFHFDRRFDRERVKDLYATWIRQSCSGSADAVFVAGFTGAPAGYATCHIEDGDRGSIGLFGVAPEFRGHGLGQQLISAALDFLRSRGLRRVEAVTQGRNIRSQQFLQRSGFILRELQLWYHWWPDPSADTMAGP